MTRLYRKSVNHVSGIKRIACPRYGLIRGGVRGEIRAPDRLVRRQQASTNFGIYALKACNVFRKPPAGHSTVCANIRMGPILGRWRNALFPARPMSLKEVGQAR